MRTRSRANVPPPPDEEPPPSVNTLGLNQFKSDFNGGSDRTRRKNNTAERADKAAPASRSGAFQPWFCVCSWHATPTWLRDNQYILHGYRGPVRTNPSCLLQVRTP